MRRGVRRVKGGWAGLFYTEVDSEKAAVIASTTVRTLVVCAKY